MNVNQVMDFKMVVVQNVSMELILLEEQTIVLIVQLEHILLEEQVNAQIVQLERIQI